MRMVSYTWVTPKGLGSCLKKAYAEKMYADNSLLVVPDR